MGQDLKSAFFNGLPATISDIDPMTSNQIKWTDTSWTFAAFGSGAFPWKGCLSMFWATNAQYLDFADVNVIRAFVGPDNSPRFLGTNGVLPTGIQPLIYFPDGDPANNTGRAQNFPAIPGLGNCSDVP